MRSNQQCYLLSTFASVFACYMKARSPTFFTFNF